MSAAAFLDNLGVMAAVPGDRRRELLDMLARAAVPKGIGEEATDIGWMRTLLHEFGSLATVPTTSVPLERWRKRNLTPTTRGD